MRFNSGSCLLMAGALRGVCRFVPWHAATPRGAAVRWAGDSLDVPLGWHTSWPVCSTQETVPSAAGGSGTMWRCCKARCCAPRPLLKAAARGSRRSSRWRLQAGSRRHSRRRLKAGSGHSRTQRLQAGSRRCRRQRRGKLLAGSRCRSRLHSRQRQASSSSTSGWQRSRDPSHSLCSQQRQRAGRPPRCQHRRRQQQQRQHQEPQLLLV